MNKMSCDSEPLKPTTTALIDELPRFRILVIGKSGVGKTTLIAKTFNVEGGSITSNLKEGISDINKELTSKNNDRFVLHDSMGFAPGEKGNFEKVVRFIEDRQKRHELKDRLHAIWHCVATSSTGGRVFETGDEDFLKLELGGVPVIVVFTKCDILISEAERLYPKEDDEQIRVRAEQEFEVGCRVKMRELMKNMNRTHPYAKVTIHDKDMLQQLVQTTQEAIGTNNPSFARVLSRSRSPRAPTLDPTTVVRLAWAIAQQVSSDLKIQASIEIGSQEHWGGISLEKHTKRLVAIHADIIKVWNFPDPDEYLTNKSPDGFIKKIFKMDDLAQSPNPVMAQLMGYIVDLSLIMQNISVALQVGKPLTPTLLDAALNTYRAQNCAQVHQEIKDYVGALQNPEVAEGVQGTDATLEKVIALIKKYRSDPVKPSLKVGPAPSLAPPSMIQSVPLSPTTEAEQALAPRNNTAEVQPQPTPSRADSAEKGGAMESCKPKGIRKLFCGCC